MVCCLAVLPFALARVLLFVLSFLRFIYFKIGSYDITLVARDSQTSTCLYLTSSEMKGVSKSLCFEPGSHILGWLALVWSLA